MTNPKNPPATSRRVRIPGRRAGAAAAAAACLTLGAMWALPAWAGSASTPSTPGGPAAVEPTVVERAREAGMSGLSPASMSEVGACRGLSPVSATGCTPSELVQAFCVGAPTGELVCATNRP